MKYIIKLISTMEIVVLLLGYSSVTLGSDLGKIADLFSTNLTLKEKDLICSIETIQMNLKLEDLPQEKWNRYTIEALGCVRPFNERKITNWYVRKNPANTDTRNKLTVCLIKENRIVGDCVSKIPWFVEEQETKKRISYCPTHMALKLQLILIRIGNNRHTHKNFINKVNNVSNKKHRPLNITH